MIEFSEPLIEGYLIKRYKRFFADIETAEGVVTAHCANTGRMTGLLNEHSRVWIRRQRPGRKLLFSWELVETSKGLVCVNTARANQLVAETALLQWIEGATLIRREPRVGKHRFDLELERESRPIFVEIKSVTLCELDGQGLFPDAPSERAVKHVKLMTELAKNGLETHLLLVAMHTGIRRIRPHASIDLDFAEACVLAEHHGVKIQAIGTRITPSQIAMSGIIPLSIF